MTEASGDWEGNAAKLLPWLLSRQRYFDMALGTEWNPFGRSFLSRYRDRLTSTRKVLGAMAACLKRKSIAKRLRAKLVDVKKALPVRIHPSVREQERSGVGFNATPCRVGYGCECFGVAVRNACKWNWSRLSRKALSGSHSPDSASLDLSRFLRHLGNHFLPAFPILASFNNTRSLFTLMSILHINQSRWL